MTEKNDLPIRENGESDESFNQRYQQWKDKFYLEFSPATRAKERQAQLDAEAAALKIEDDKRRAEWKPPTETKIKNRGTGEVVFQSRALPIQLVDVNVQPDLKKFLSQLEARIMKLERPVQVEKKSMFGRFKNKK